ncbi:ABC-type uncharacterized transport system involved in gliding motility, auxiliary component [Desulfacinum hydrothermale DSM 13146]|uniref:ABC-type uncharacterized transport system involved in gliding motility, auxiliary component n=1 Tax=Desulfacinum hydrothermale DSM 13146 TaxID=1121390 RepID=A0A1W1XHA2_9BACT|nr:DUF4350 domain-containing protein [Desulfacinum hydrothermale]SMC23373.1 ABC-type uncharacterized transport system involved in gliding motility, auxiliary component [Desulfacinum hydrothermale DSM 13146]
MPKQKKARRSLVYGSNALVSTLVFLAILVFVALIAQRHPLRVDLTESGEFSLSEQSRKVVESLQEPVTIKAFFATASPQRLKTKDLLETYRYHNKKIRYEFVDPDRRPEVARQYEIRDYGTLVLEGFGRKETVLRADEEAITNALLKLSRKKKKKIYFLTGHGEHSLDEINKVGYSTVKSALEKENYTVEKLNLLQRENVPEDAAVLIVAGPHKPLFPEEVASLEAYVKRGGKVVVFLDPGLDGGLKDFVRSLGIQVGDDMVIDKLSRVFGGSYLMPVVTRYGAHKITEGFNVATFYSEARSVRPVKKPPEGVTVVTLATTSENAWAETDLDRLHRGEASFEEGQDAPGPVPLVVLAAVDTNKLSKSSSTQTAQEKAGREGRDEAGVAHAAETRLPTGYLVVAGDSDFVDNTHFGLSGNGDFFLNTIHFLAEEETLITIEPRKKEGQTLILTQDQARLVFWVPLVLIPALVLAVGLGVYRMRRAQR